MEIWKDIEGYEEFYQVSNLGRVKSIERLVDHPKGGKRIVRERFLAVKTNKRGYLYSSLSKNGIVTNQFNHRLVAFAFISNPENKPEVNHKNGIKTDNYLENLEWCNRSENEVHARKIGLKKTKKGENSNLSKLTDLEAKIIKYNFKGVTHNDIAILFGISKHQVSKIKQGKSWSHI